MNFITIDFETATAQRNSPCEIGLTFVQNQRIVDTKSWLIRPINNEFDQFNISIHGITPEDVAGKPEFNELWSEIKPFIENQFLIAHNAGFDVSVLRRTLAAYNLAFPKLNYACSYIFSKKVWSGLPAYDLATLCQVNNIDLDHHRAGPDSKATAELSLRAFTIAQISSLDDLPKKLKTVVGQLYDGGYKPCRTIATYEPKPRVNKPRVQVVGNPDKLDVDSIFYNKTVVFTGTLLSMVRLKAQKLIADLGGIVEHRVTKNTDFLVVGQKNYRRLDDSSMSCKQKAAIRLVEQGSKLEILSETDFLKNL